MSLVQSNIEELSFILWLIYSKHWQTGPELQQLKHWIQEQNKVITQHDFVGELQRFDIIVGWGRDLPALDGCGLLSWGSTTTTQANDQHKLQQY